MHFVATCLRYPEFALNVHALRPHFDKRGLNMDSTVIHFQNGVFDSKEADLTEEEANIVHEAFKRCKNYPPLYGSHIIVKEYPEEKIETKKGK